MIDLKYLQNNFKEASARLEKKGVGSATLEKLQTLFSALKSTNATLESMKAEQNSMSRLFGEYKREGKDVTELKAKVDANKEAMIPVQEKARQTEEALYAVALAIPNFPDDSVPEGTDEEDNVELRKVLEPRSFDFRPKEHWELSENIKIADINNSRRNCISRFGIKHYFLQLLL